MNRIDLVVGSERTTLDRHHEVAHPFGVPVAISIAHLCKFATKGAAISGLFVDLTQRRFGRGLTGIELAFGQRPIAVARPVHQQYALAIVR